MASSPLTRRAIPFIDDLGVDFVEAPPGEGCVVLQLEPRHLNSLEVAHGGVLMTLLDVAMAVAGRSIDPESRGGVTVEMKTTFVQAGLAGSRLTASGKAYHRSTTMTFCEGEIRDESGRLVAKATGTFKTLRRNQSVARPPRERAEPFRGEGSDAD